MTKKVLAVLMSVAIMISCTAFTVSAAEELVFYVEQGATGGDGTEEEPYGTLEDAIWEFEGKDGTIKVIGTYDMSAFSYKEGWEGMVTITAAQRTSLLVIKKQVPVRLYGDITFKDIKFELEAWANMNPMGTKLIMDGGGASEFSYSIHLSTYSNDSFESGYAEFKSGYVETLYAGGGYSTSYANGLDGDSDIIVDGAEIGKIVISADKFKDEQTGISIGGNLNIIYNAGKIGSVSYNEVTKPEILGALNFVFNNGMQAPEIFDYPTDSVTGGVFVIKSAKGGLIMPTTEVGVFEVKADKGKIAEIGGLEVLNGKVTLEPGETIVNWIDGQQPGDEPIEIKLTIDSKEIVKNGVATELDVPAQIVDSRTLVPLRAIFEALGASVEWDGETSTVTSEKDGTAVKLTIGENKIYVNGEARELDVPAQIIESRTMVPARAVAEAYGCEVEWDGDTRTVIIKK